MAGEIAFAANYSDLSTDNVVQLEFRCSRCGNGYPAELDTFELSAASSAGTRGRGPASSAPGTSPSRWPPPGRASPSRRLAHTKMAEEDERLTEADWREGITDSCPACSAAAATNAELCAQCDAALKAARPSTQFGARLEPNARFCSGYGAPAAERRTASRRESARKRCEFEDSTATSDCSFSNPYDNRRNTACVPLLVLVERGARMENGPPPRR